jgi:hypothetical protein
MSTVTRWWIRAGAALSAVLAIVLVPAAAWAHSAPGTVLIEAARRRPRFGGGLFVFGLLCCLVVVGGIVLLVLLISRRRRR